MHPLYHTTICRGGAGAGEKATDGVWRWWEGPQQTPHCTVGCTINNNNCCTLGTVAAIRNNNCSSAPRDTAQCTVVVRSKLNIVATKQQSHRDVV